MQPCDHLFQSLWVLVRLGCSVFFQLKIRVDAEYFAADFAGFIRSFQGGIGTSQHQERIDIAPIALESFFGSGNCLLIAPAAVVGGGQNGRIKYRITRRQPGR